jgi:hypothetical protein
MYILILLATRQFQLATLSDQKVLKAEAIMRVSGNIAAKCLILSFIIVRDEDCFVVIG